MKARWRRRWSAEAAFDAALGLKKQMAGKRPAIANFNEKTTDLFR
jgi:hypothetical protein